VLAPLPDSDLRLLQAIEDAAMRLSDLSYKVYRASSGTSSFWRWDVFLKKRRIVPLKSGYVHGTMADAKQQASAAMSKLADTGKMRLENEKRRR
jgi:hypothetical protein